MTSKHTVAVLLPRTQDAASWQERHSRGEVRDRSPYGYGRAAAIFNLVWSRTSPDGPVVRRVRARLNRWLGFDLLHVWQNRALVLESDLVWTHTEREHLAIACLQLVRRRRQRTPVLAQSVWLWESWDQLGPLRRRFLAVLLRRHPIEVVHSTTNRDVSRRAVPGRTVERIPFGTTVPSRRESAPTEPLTVIAAGNDIDRDWATLARVAAQLPAIPFRVVSRSRAARQTTWSSNVTIKPAETTLEMDAIYRSAAVAVIPSRPNRHASGLTSTIEALAAGLPTVVTRAGGIEEYVGEDAELVATGDVNELLDAVQSALAGTATAPSRNGYLRRGLTQADYVGRYVRISEWLLQRTEYPNEAFRLEPLSGVDRD